MPTSTRSEVEAFYLHLAEGVDELGRIEWVDELAGPSEREPVLAWGKAMALDLTYSVLPFQQAPPRLAPGTLRAPRGWSAEVCKRKENAGRVPRKRKERRDAPARADHSRVGSADS